MVPEIVSKEHFLGKKAFLETWDVVQEMTIEEAAGILREELRDWIEEAIALHRGHPLWPSQETREGQEVLNLLDHHLSDALRDGWSLKKLRAVLETTALAERGLDL